MAYYYVSSTKALNCWNGACVCNIVNYEGEKSTAREVYSGYWNKFSWND